MDQPLKQRLIGVTLAVALVVIFVPMLFEKSDDKGKLSTAGIPSIPDDVLEKPLELPKTAEDLAPKEEEAKKAPVESGYRIVPFNEEAQPKPEPPAAAVKKPAEPKADNPKQPDAADKTQQIAPIAEGTDEPDVEDDIAPAQEPASSPQAKPKPAPPAAKRAEVADKPQTAKLAEPLRPAVKKAEAANKPQTAKPTEPTRPAVKTVKAAKPKPPAPSLDTGEADEPISPASPGKTVAPVAKPKPQAMPVPPRRPAEVPAKKPEPAKPAADIQRPSAKAEKPDSERDAAQAPVARPVAPKPAAAPAKPAQAAAKAAPPKKPSAWVVQAGSFIDETAARNFADRLKQSKVPASVHAIQGEHGPIYRVQVGAVPDRSRAEETLKQIEGSTGVNGIIMERH